MSTPLRTIRVTSRVTGPAVTVSVVDPVAIAVATPVVAWIVATVVFEDDHAAVAPAMTVPPVSRTWALKAFVCPGANIVSRVGTPMIEPGICWTVMGMLPVTVPALAVTVVAPLATAVTSPPDAFTVATAGFVEAQVKLVPLTAAPAAVRAVAVSCRVAPIDAMLVAAETSMVAIAGGPGVSGGVAA